MTSVSGPPLAAIVVSYFPDDAVLMRLMTSLAGQVHHLILVDNGGGDAVAQTLQRHGERFAYVPLGKNLGLGRALNAGFEQASAMGADYVATFDQDSAPPDDLVGKLLEVHQQLKARGTDCAAVGPVFYDRREAEKTYFPFYVEKNGHIQAAHKVDGVQSVVPADALITSGMLVRMDVWRSGVRYDDALFVDYTDTEWCFRVRAKGHQLFGCMNVEMGHAPSDAPPARIAGRPFFRYSPLRRYYYFRNTIRFCLAPYVSFAWKRRLGLGLALRFGVNLVIDPKKMRSLAMMLRGVWDGLRGRSGEFQK